MGWIVEFVVIMLDPTTKLSGAKIFKPAEIDALLVLEGLTKKEGAGMESVWLGCWDRGAVAPLLEEHEASSFYLVCCILAKHIVLASSEKTIQLWDAETGMLLQPLLEEYKDWVRPISFSPTGKHIMLASKRQCANGENGEEGGAVYEDINDGQSIGGTGEDGGRGVPLTGTTEEQTRIAVDGLKCIRKWLKVVQT